MLHALRANLNFIQARNEATWKNYKKGITALECTPDSILKDLSTATSPSTKGDTVEALTYTRHRLGVLRPSIPTRTACCSEVDLQDASQPVVALDIDPGQRGSTSGLIGRAIAEEARSCPVCGSKNDGVVNVNVPNKMPRPDLFFARVGGVGLDYGEDFDMDQGVSLSHFIHEYEEIYSLCGLIYRAEHEYGSIHFSCQLYLDAGWWKYDGGVGDGRLVHCGDFERSYGDANEYLLMFLRADSVTAAYGKEAVVLLKDKHKVSPSRREIWIRGTTICCVSCYGFGSVVIRSRTSNPSQLNLVTTLNLAKPSFCDNQGGNEMS